MPVKRMPQILIITSGFEWRIRNGIKEFHHAVDLRTVRFLPGKGIVPQWALQPIVATEDMRVKRAGIDSYGNYYTVAEPLETDYSDLIYVHTTWPLKGEGEIYRKHEFMGHSRIGGNSPAHHLHFAVKKNNVIMNPVLYLNETGWKHRKKRRRP